MESKICAYCKEKFYKGRDDLKRWKIRKYCGLDCYHKGCAKYNDFRIDGDIALFRAGTVEFFIDKEDVEKIQTHRWRYDCGYIKTNIRGIKGVNNRMIFLHHIICGRILTQESGLMVDHINRNTLDNRKVNLRVVTRTINSRNRKVRSDNKLGVNGISWEKRGKRYVVSISSKYIGRFKTFEDALSECQALRNCNDSIVQ